MAGKRFKEIQAGTAGILATAVFLLAWSVVETITGTEPKGAPPGFTFHAAKKAGATVTPSEPPSPLDRRAESPASPEHAAGGRPH